MNKMRTWDDLDINDQVNGLGRFGGSSRGSRSRRRDEPEGQDSTLLRDVAVDGELHAPGTLGPTQDDQGIDYEFALADGTPSASPKPVQAKVTCRACGIEQSLPVCGWSQVRPTLTAAGWCYGPGGTLRWTWCPQCRHTGESE